MDLSREPFPFLLGGNGWAIELTKAEWLSLVPVVDEVIDQHEKLKPQLLPDESISLDLEREPWVVSLKGDKHKWSIQLILLEDQIKLRSFEVSWPSPVAQTLTKEMRRMWESYR
mgnify:CR=1 FL=1|tara:strand:+ start:957 stop:1298 length:342 start_codon:yes stop_codon:yes gene_type:complete